MRLHLRLCAEPQPGSAPHTAHRICENRSRNSPHQRYGRLPWLFRTETTPGCALPAPSLSWCRSVSTRSLARTGRWHVCARSGWTHAQAVLGQSCGRQKSGHLGPIHPWILGPLGLWTSCLSSLRQLKWCDLRHPWSSSLEFCLHQIQKHRQKIVGLSVWIGVCGDRLWTESLQRCRALEGFFASNAL